MAFVVRGIVCVIFMFKDKKYVLEWKKEIIKTIDKKEKSEIIAETKKEWAKNESSDRNVNIFGDISGAFNTFTLNVFYTFIDTTEKNKNSSEENVSKLEKKNTSAPLVFNLVFIIVCSIWTYCYAIAVIDFSPIIGQVHDLGTSLLGYPWEYKVEAFNNGFKLILYSDISFFNGLEIKYTYLMNSVSWTSIFILWIIAAIFEINTNTLIAFILPWIIFIIFLPIFVFVQILRSEKKDLSVLLCKLSLLFLALSLDFINHSRIKFLVCMMSKGQLLLHIPCCCEVIVTFAFVLAIYNFLIFEYAKVYTIYEKANEKILTCSILEIFCFLFSLNQIGHICRGKGFNFLLLDPTILNINISNCNKMLIYHNVYFITNDNIVLFIIFYLCFFITLPLIIKCIISKDSRDYFLVRFNKLSTFKKLLVVLMLMFSLFAFLDFSSRLIIYSSCYPYLIKHGLPSYVL